MRWWVLLLLLPLALSACGRAAEDSAWAGLDYVALGDSYTAAPGTGVDLGEACYQSARNYPRLVASALQLDLTDASCGGARIGDLTGVQRRTAAPPQFRALSVDTDLVTLRIGANNSSLYARTAYQCPQLARQAPHGAPCADELGGAAFLDAVATEIRTELEEALARIERLAPSARIVVVGYPEWAPPATTRGCDELPLADGDHAFVRRANEVMVTELRDAALAAEVAYVDVWAATEGHHMCAPDPWIAGVTPRSTAAALHPYPREQAVTADLVEELLRSEEMSPAAAGAGDDGAATVG
ncbi:SGNH/GDSL hydrolase family protein [Nocardioides panacisoli]|uniref:SGNH/GDSL hydrolase family protein n=1 Tax=Nocardioides panacisoli TaxID=627624 RepID=UPI001C62CAB7|nr:SGNH/GDSL hydrolase family protein [Nocardioides panacisoli]QYJ02946.1 SGNH/GDSL hydrolase family protein [Nocardioides panacisoli]